ncbi:MAG: outer membrane protein OmpA-like peptidoglycan-associated protein [Oceanicoccus sp.]|jgi:outer membrane protein OmpA-like peptidoglycan-associated protein
MKVDVTMLNPTKIPMLRNWLVLLFLCSGSFVHAVSYGPSLHQAEWRLELSPFECRLWQPIPAFGEAVFSNRAGEEQKFYLAPVKPLMKAGKANLISRGPVWDESRESVSMGQVAVKAAAKPVLLGKHQSYRLLNELYDGKSPIFTQQSWFQDSELVEVFMSSVHFRKAYSEYKGCLIGLLPVNFDQIRRSRINFTTAKSSLTRNIKDQLDKIAQYVKADPLEISFFIDGHTDSRGRRLLNLELSKKRAEAVTQYLVARGVNEELISTRYHGELYPVKNNKTAKNRKDNRRVTIRLERKGDV